MMRYLQILLLLLTCTQANAASVLGVGAMQCSLVVSLYSADEGDIVENAVTNWAQGFFSGINAASDQNVGRDNAEKIFDAILTRCQNNPSDRLLLTVGMVYGNFKDAGM